MAGARTGHGQGRRRGFNLLDLGGNWKGAGGGGTGLGVNSFLWRATLDTIAIMPLTSADPFGGVIITDWYAAGEAPAERFKMNVYIMGRELRADGARVAVFRRPGPRSAPPKETPKPSALRSGP